MTLAARNWFVGAAVLEPGRGGIARVGRMSIRALLDAGCEVQGHSYLDLKGQRVGSARFSTARASRISYVAACHRAAFSRAGFLYDSVGMARAHPKLPGLPRRYAVWMHGIEVWNSLTPPRRRALERAALVLVNSQFTLDRYRSLHGPLENAQVCPLATEANSRPEPADPVPHPPTVLVLGRLDTGGLYKGQKELIETWPTVVQAIPEARLLIAGSGTGQAEVAQWVQGSPVAHRIEMRGFVPENDLPALWAETDIFAMPSRGEGFGLVYVEAMRHGKPVIASVHDAGQEVNRHGRTGYNVSLDDPADLGRRLISLFSAPDKARAMGLAGQKLWAEQYRYSAFRSRLTDILAEAQL